MKYPFLAAVFSVLVSISAMATGRELYVHPNKQLIQIEDSQLPYFLPFKVLAPPPVFNHDVIALQAKDSDILMILDLNHHSYKVLTGSSGLVNSTIDKTVYVDSYSLELFGLDPKTSKFSKPILRYSLPYSPTYESFISYEAQNRRSFEFSEDSRWLMTTISKRDPTYDPAYLEERAILIWDLQNNTSKIVDIPHTIFNNTRKTISEDGGKLVIQNGSYVRVYDLNKQQVINEFQIESQDGQYPHVEGHTYLNPQIHGKLAYLPVQVSKSAYDLNHFPDIYIYDIETGKFVGRTSVGWAQQFYVNSSDNIDRVYEIAD